MLLSVAPGRALGSSPAFPPGARFAHSCGPSPQSPAPPSPSKFSPATKPTEGPSRRPATDSAPDRMDALRSLNSSWHKIIPRLSDDEIREARTSQEIVCFTPDFALGIMPA